MDLATMLENVPLAPLGPGSPVEAMRPALEDPALFAGLDREAASACRAGLWLAFGFLDESHAISQELTTREGSYWHALMHRREPDGANAKYWFLEVGTHPIFADLAREAAELRTLGMGRDWDPFAFVDHCDESRDTGSEVEEACKRVQLLEWRMLFDWGLRGEKS
jgi:hypothetical protein